MWPVHLGVNALQDIGNGRFWHKADAIRLNVRPNVRYERGTGIFFQAGHIMLLDVKVVTSA